MKQLFLTIFMMICVATLVAQSGTSCYDAIPIDKDYQATIDGRCTMWYTASTYDLPITVRFIPASGSGIFTPDIAIDLTCTPGVYDDPMIDSLIRLADSKISFPYELAFEPEGNEYVLSIAKTYRDNLAEFGVTYPVQAYVKVNFYEAGIATLNPDKHFSNCINNATYVNLGDTFDIMPSDPNRVFVFPYTDWKNDSIRFVWEGEGTAQVYVAVQECDFTPSITDPYCITSFDMAEEAPFKMYSEEINATIDENGNGGLYYAKVITQSAGKLIVEKIPETIIVDNSLLLEYGQTISVSTISDKVYRFPITWQATEFLTNIPDSVAMYMSTIYNFQADPNDPNVFATYHFDVLQGKRFYQFSTLEMDGVTSRALDGFVYVQFVAQKPTQLTVNQWNASDCAKNSRLIRPNKRFTVNKSNIYRLRYNDFVGYDMKISWTGTKKLTASIAEDCELSNVIYSVDIAARKSVTIAVADLETWASRVDNEGFVYLKFTSSSTGNLTFSTDKPEDITPVVPTSPCVASSIELKSGDQLTLNLDSAFTIYRIEYAAWKDQGMSLSWTGTTDLHTFIAETCNFAVAPYNKYVHVYVPVQGEHTLDANAMADLAEYVDEDGYLYIRFLTEKEGVLEVK